MEATLQPSALLAVEDVTARRQAEEALRQEALRKDEFLAALSHELRNPLAPISNALSLLRRLPAGSKQATGALAIIDRQVSHLTQVVEDLLDLTRVARGKIRLKREPVEIVGLFRRTVEDHRSGFESQGVRLHCHSSAKELWADGDTSRLAQVLGNLLGNALKFTNPRDSVQVSVVRDGEEGVLRVHDSGVGMTSETVKRLFEPFSQGPQTLERSRGGLGLGLATVKGIVELHGGTVEATSAGPDRGSEFVVRLPLVARPAEAAREVAAPVAREVATGAASGQRVLIIEDNADAAQSLKDLIELLGHEVQVANDGQSGIFACRAMRPDVVLCDIGLPGLSGFDVARGPPVRGRPWPLLPRCPERLREPR